MSDPLYPHSSQASSDTHRGGAVCRCYVRPRLYGHDRRGGRLRGDGRGTVDVNWARERHSLWVQDEMSQTGPNKS